MHPRDLEGLRQGVVEDGFEVRLEGKAAGDSGSVPVQGRSRRGLSPWYAQRYLRLRPA